MKEHFRDFKSHKHVLYISNEQNSTKISENYPGNFLHLSFTRNFALQILNYAILRQKLL